MSDQACSEQTPVVTHNEMFVAIELSGVSWLVAVHAPHADKISRHQIESGNGTALIDLLEAIRKRSERVLGREIAIYSCYEAGFDGFWLHRQLVAAGINNTVIDPASIQVNRRARRAKTDGLDVEALLRALMASRRGDKRVCAMVRVPTVKEEDDRRIGREREGLIKERIRHVNRIKGLLATQGVLGYEPLRSRRQERLDALRTGDGRPLPPRLYAEISRSLRRLELVLEILREIEIVRDEEAAASARTNGVVGRLMMLRAIGPEVATVLHGEALHRTFDNRRQVAAYAGLTPSPWSSGTLQREQGISKAGNPRLRKTMVELAWLWLRYQPGSRLSAWFRERVGDGKGRMKRIAIVALARKLLVALWRYIDTGLVPEGCLMKV
ncbi:MAG TPA: IS110 family transposase [Candidatus Deferrimicrobiaceae bacterium]|nr:IS110 family transposase [Candidatus Deferrimicrobiaceae bacterium]